jgi:hypothetical protein
MRAEATESSALTAGAAHLLCFAGLAAAHTLAGRGALVSDPALALRLLVVFSLTSPPPVPVNVSSVSPSFSLPIRTEHFSPSLRSVKRP